MPAPNNRDRFYNMCSRQIFTFILAALLTGMCGRDITDEVSATCTYNNHHPYRNTALNRQRYFLNKTKRFEEKMDNGASGFMIPLVVVTEYDGNASKPYTTALTIVDETKAKVAKPAAAGTKMAAPPKKIQFAKMRPVRNTDGRVGKPTSQTDKSITPRPPLTPKFNPKTRVKLDNTPKGTAGRDQQDRRFVPAIPPRLPSANGPIAHKPTPKSLKSSAAKESEMMKAYLISLMGIVFLFLQFG